MNPSYSRRGTDDVRECAYTEEQRVAGVRNWRGFALLEASRRSYVRAAQRV